MEDGADAEMGGEVSADVGPVVEDGGADLDGGDHAEALPFFDGARGFLEAAGEFVFGDELVPGRAVERIGVHHNVVLFSALPAAATGAGCGREMVIRRVLRDSSEGEKAMRAATYGCGRRECACGEKIWKKLLTGFEVVES